MRAFGEERARELLEGARVACIGPITADTARGYGLEVAVEAEEYTIAGLIEAVRGLLSGASAS